MKDESDLQSPQGTPGADVPAVRGADGSRRRFLKGGAIGAPVVLTLTSRPVFGSENAFACVAPSRMISGNFSGFTGPTTCGGSARSVWEAAAQSRPKPAWAKRKFTEVFGGANPYTSKGTGKPKKLGEVLLDSIAELDGKAVPGFASYIIAAYLNALTNSSVSAVLAPAQVIHMWNDIVTTGQYCPQLAMCWDANGVIDYLKNSGIVPG